MIELQDYLGRIFTRSQLPLGLQQQAQTLSGMIEKKGKLWCNRCGQVVNKEKQQLPIGAYYCRSCVRLGRVRSDEKLYYFPQAEFPKTNVLTWEGRLTDYQAKVSQGLVEAVAKQKNSLVHAVTGAGKTEMIYQVVAQVINEGGAVCLASPRIDVCLELHRRLQEDFSCDIALLHGESEVYFRSPLVIATTHQLLKFYRAFDLLIVDEVDAFPYVDNPMLYHAVTQSVKEQSTIIFLTATSTDELDKKVSKGELNRLSLPRRFHGNPLIVPKKVWLENFQKYLNQKKLVPKLEQFVKKQRKTGFPLLIFASEIKRGQELAEVLQSYFSSENVGFVASTTENRLDIVEKFRQKEITILVTTTILERGVTFPCVDVFVVEANHRLFSRSALVQIAGRVGRSMDRPTGELLFFHDGTNFAIERAIQEIKAMNQEAGL
ncbi:DEAD/DEAH box helicase [Streptococcus intermedius]|uniref:DEAD/DEAH box helicase n=1 Tax=Streptococcus intermedius TaxID=1338 RepID=UPI00025B74C0|nr:DEAD/DEAH box helicase [Streptococcus intermedius]EID82110.1 DEAD/DEAH box helicase / helicase C-terminal domain multi-domain protein [Streptococcus intermedius SK54 = ATCC 27335]EPH04978.1 competence protein ComFA [Streptococcus intermedius SK54 = ATCC 27335]BAM23046.1 superfamily II ATP-dependent DNA/RNA helicase [Streptococcus intermedius JTH08]SQH51451.1 putative ATP-dependent RNA helicase [Streptococcus intermedius]